MWRSQEKNSSFSTSPFQSPLAEVLQGCLHALGSRTCGGPTAAGSSLPWGGSSEGKQDTGCGKERSSQGLNFLTPSKSALVSLQFHQCFAGGVSLMTLAVFHSSCYEFARCP